MIRHNFSNFITFPKDMWGTEVYFKNAVQVIHQLHPKLRAMAPNKESDNNGGIHL